MSKLFCLYDSGRMAILVRMNRLCISIFSFQPIFIWFFMLWLPASRRESVLSVKIRYDFVSGPHCHCISSRSTSEGTIWVCFSFHWAICVFFSNRENRRPFKSLVYTCVGSLWLGRQLNRYSLFLGAHAAASLRPSENAAKKLAVLWLAIFYVPRSCCHCLDK